jgi:hypothetical protein
MHGEPELLTDGLRLYWGDGTLCTLDEAEDDDEREILIDCARRVGAVVIAERDAIASCLEETR